MAPHAEEVLDSSMSSNTSRAPAMNGFSAFLNGSNGANGVSGHYSATNGSNGPNGIVQNGTHIKTRKIPKSQFVLPTPADELHDLICVGFGPASLAIAVAIHDALESRTLSEAPKVMFIEKQESFAWHAGMLLPGAKMQISFIKDMASLRDPRSHFTFLNYLHKNGRLVHFTNLDTFLPARVEYEDYLRWCASHFEDVVKYSNEAVSVRPEPTPAGGDSSVKIFEVVSRNTKTGVETRYRAKNVILALGGQASIPRPLPQAHPKVIHSSQYAHVVPRILRDTSAPYKVAVIGAGQSAAEIFSNVQTLYPNSRTWMVMKSEFLKPSDDSPFVNSIFNPEFVDNLYPRASSDRRHLIREAKATNYGVVRLELIEKLYELMYEQRRELGSDEKQWPHRIMNSRRVISCEPIKGDRLRLRVKPASATIDEVDDLQADNGEEEEFDADLVVCATGYKRDAHVGMLQSMWGILPQLNGTQSTPSEDRKYKVPVFDSWEVQPPADSESQGTRSLSVGRDYKVRFAPDAVAPGSGVYLQGCCEGTHGLSDTLLSILSTRSGDIVNSIFGPSN
ncbi:hypothetical protein PspLS_06865 [Pyricularia sp. CBS 133598]|nr:hypothetical protein PspLS_06865 [Pyricularia sp. CBS 133598]